MSLPPLRVFLNTKEDRSLWELTQAAEIPQKVKERVQVLRLYLCPTTYLLALLGSRSAHLPRKKSLSSWCSL
jgi:hypothetical protein